MVSRQSIVSLPQKIINVFFLCLICFFGFNFLHSKNRIVQSNEYVCIYCQDGSNFNCVVEYPLTKTGCSEGPASYSEQESEFCSDCDDGTRLCQTQCKTRSVISEDCVIPGDVHYSYAIYDANKAGTCTGSPGGGSGDTNGTAELRNLQCPVACTPGQTFTITYEYRSTGYTGSIDLWRKVWAYGKPPWTGVLGWHTTLNSCLRGDLLSPSEWQTITQQVECNELYNLGGNPNLFVFAYNRDDGASGHSAWCASTDSPTSDASLGCSVARTLGTVRVYGGPTLGILKLNLVPAQEAVDKNLGTAKIARFAGDINTAFDLVELNAPDVSPVRIFTGLGGFGGIKSWRWLKE